MIRARFYIGTTTRDGLPVKAEAWHTIEGLAIAEYGGFTMTEALGGWKDDDGRIIREPSRVYETCGHCNAKEFAEQCRNIAEQSSVLYTVETVEGGFV